MGHLLDGLSDALERLSDKVSIVLMCIFVAIVLMGVVFRYVLVLPLTWSEEVARYAMVWMAFISGSVALKRGEHVNVDTLLLLVRSQRLLALLGLLVHLAIGWFLVVLTVHGVRLVHTSFATTTPALGIPLAWPYLGVPIGSVLMLVHVVAFLCRDIKRLRSGKPTPSGNGEATPC